MMAPYDPTKRLRVSDRLFKVGVILTIVATVITLAAVAFLIIHTQTRYQEYVRDASAHRDEQLREIEESNQKIRGLVECIILNPSSHTTDENERLKDIRKCADEHEGV